MLAKLFFNGVYLRRWLVIVLAIALLGGLANSRAEELLQKPVIPHERIAKLRAELKELGFGVKPYDDVAQAVVDSSSAELAFRLLLEGPEFDLREAMREGQLARIQLIHLAEQTGWGPLFYRSEEYLGYTRHPAALKYFVEHWPPSDRRENSDGERNLPPEYQLEWMLPDAAEQKSPQTIDFILKLHRGSPRLAKHLSEALSQAIQKEGLPMVQSLLDAGADPNVKAMNYYYLPVQWAAWQKEPQIAQLLLDRGAKLDACTAACLGRLDDLKRLIDEPLPQNLQETPAPKPLFWAVRGGNLECVRYLLDHGADADEHGLLGATPLRAATWGGNVEIVRLLLDRGADPKQLIHDHSLHAQQLAPIHNAAATGNLDILKLFIERDVSPWLQGEAATSDWSDGSPDGRHHPKNSPLTIAVGNKQPKVVDYLLKLALEQLQKEPEKLTPIDVDTAFSVAAAQGDLELVHELLKAGARVNGDQSIDQRMPLEAAAGGGHLEIVKFLLESGANVDGAGKDTSRTPLHAAAAGGHLEIVRSLLDAGAAVDARRPAPAEQTEERGIYRNDRDDHKFPGIRPLMSAVVGEHADVVKLLLERGSQPNLERRTFGPGSDSDRYHPFRHLPPERVATPLEASLIALKEWPSKRREVACARHLIEAGAKLDPALEGYYLRGIVSSGDIERLELLERMGVKVTPDDASLLAIAVNHERREMVKTLLARGFDPFKYQDGSHWYSRGSPFDLARQDARTLMLATLIESSPDRPLPIRYDSDARPYRPEGTRSQTLITQTELFRFYGGTPLARNNRWFNDAILQDDVERIKKFLEQGYDPNEPHEKRYPLVVAAYHMRADVMEMLFDHGAKIDVLPEKGAELLRQACESRQETPDVLKMFLDRGADSNRPDSRGDTPLHLAIMKDRLSLARLMVNDRTPYDVYTAAAMGNLDELNRQSSKNAALIIQARPDGKTPLDWAIIGGQRETTQRLLELGAPFDNSEKKLVAAVQSGNPKFLGWLLETVDQANRSPKILATVLDAAIRKRPQPEMVRELLAHGADPKSDGSPLILAAGHGDIELMKLLIDAGADVNASVTFDKKHVTLVRDMGESGSTTALRKTIVAKPLGIEYDRRKASYEVLLDEGRKRNIVAARWLLEHGANPRTSCKGIVCVSVLRGDVDLVRTLLKAGADPNDCSDAHHGLCALVAAVELNKAGDQAEVSHAMIDLLLEHGANPNGAGSRGGRQSPLDEATQNKDTEAAKRIEAAINQQGKER